MCRFDYSWFLYCAVLILITGFKKYELNADSSLIYEAHKIALTQVGVIEKAENKGEEIKDYLSSVGLGEGYSYCAAGIYWAFDSASKALDLINPLPRTGVANRVFNYAKNNGNKSSRNIGKYDLIIWRENNSWQGHIEWVNEVQKAGWIRTIGFNTSQNGKGGVFIQRRNIYHPLGRLKLRGLVGFNYDN